LEQVRIITWRMLREFGSRWPASVGPIREWYGVTQRATWRNFTEVKATFGQTDQAVVRSGQRVCIFDIGGNKFRLVAFVSYAKRKVYVLRVMTHKEYDKSGQRWKQDL
jgi:mRNA interferase HigB